MLKSGLRVLDFYGNCLQLSRDTGAATSPRTRSHQTPAATVEMWPAAPEHGMGTEGFQQRQAVAPAVFFHLSLRRSLLQMQTEVSCYLQGVFVHTFPPRLSIFNTLCPLPAISFPKSSSSSCSQQTQSLGFPKSQILKQKWLFPSQFCGYHISACWELVEEARAGHAWVTFSRSLLGGQSTKPKVWAGL